MSRTPAATERSTSAGVTGQQPRPGEQDDAAGEPRPGEQRQADPPQTPNYVSYLKLPELLTLQEPLSTPVHPEELHFIVVHQGMELWFKLLLHDVTRLVQAIDADDFVAAMTILRRVNHAVEICIAQTASLQDMPPWSFHEFRGYLGTASGMQSIQFREIEVLSGMRDPATLAAAERGPQSPTAAAISARLAQRSLAQAHQEAGARHGITDWADLYVEPEIGPQLCLLTELLMDYEALWIRWRSDHITLVTRSVGPRAVGTGGTAAVSYLEQRARGRFFPHLWDARNELSLRSGGQLVS